VPEGTDIPAPPSADQLAALDGSAGAGAGTTAPVEEPPQAGGQGPVSGPGVDLADGFLPVLNEVPSPGPGAACPTGHVGSLDTGCYDLGEDGAVGLDAVASADAALVAGQWGVQLALTDEGIDAFNRLAGVCYAYAPTCPMGRIAVVVSGQVISAPIIATPEFEADQVQISGVFTAAEAETIAEAMTG
jgi:SecD-like export protein